MKYLVEGQYNTPEWFLLDIEADSKKEAEDTAVKTIEQRVPESMDIYITRAENIDG